MRRILLIGLLAAVVSQIIIAADKKPRKTIRRVKPPNFSKSDIDVIFFRNVFEDGGIVGKRPANLGAPRAPIASGGGNVGSGVGSDSGGLYAWKDVVDAEIVETEVKRISMKLDKVITTPGKYASGGFKEARTDFSMLATLFAIAGEYDADIRWKKDAPELRDLFARSAANAKVGTIQAYNEAKSRRDELKDLIRGGTFSSAKKSERKANWYNVVHRVPLMQRLETAQNTNLKPWTSSENEFKGKKDEVRHEANIVAAIADVLSQEGMEEAEEDDYNVHSKSMKKAARDIVDAIKLDNYANVVKAVGVIGQSCDSCHEDWR